MKPVIAIHLAAVLLLAACSQSTPPASVASIAEQGGWHNSSRQNFISLKDDEIQVGATPYNGGKNIPQFKDEFFVFAEVMVDVPGYEFDPGKVSLQIGGKNYPAQGFDCKPPAPIESKTARKAIGKFDFQEQYNCVWLRFALPPPAVGTAFSLNFGGLKFHDQEVVVPVISFRQGAVKSMFGF